MTFIIIITFSNIYEGRPIPAVEGSAHQFQPMDILIDLRARSIPFQFPFGDDHTGTNELYE
jgi:hypothetical protein